MGLGQSTLSTAAQLQAVYGRLAVDDRDTFASLFKEHASGATKQLKADALRQCCAFLPKKHSDALYHVMRANSGHEQQQQQLVDELGFVKTIAAMTRGTPDERAAAIVDWTLVLAGRVPNPSQPEQQRQRQQRQHQGQAQNASDPPVTMGELRMLVEGVALAALKCHQALRSHPDNVASARDAFVTMLMDEGSAPNAPLTKDDVRQWFAKATMFSKLWSTLVEFSFLHREEVLEHHNQDATATADRAEHHDDHDAISEKRKAESREAGLRLPRIRGQPSSILTWDTIWMVNQHVPAPCRHMWRALYNDRVHGKSWTKFTKSLISQGLTVIVIEDEAGAQFGAFASVNWTKNAKWYGNTSCFLFSLSPQSGVFNAGTLNDHYMYLNFGTETLPNGLAMGGQHGYCGLWLQEGLEEGHSKGSPRSTTYQSPRLSKEETFKIAHIEVWCVLENEVDPNRETGPSILDQYKEDQIILEWAGREMHSKAYRDGGADAEIED